MAQVIDWLRHGQAEPVVQLATGPLPVAIRRHPRARRLTMRLAPDGSEVRITMPRWGRTADALDFACSRVEWIEAQLARMPQALVIGPGALLPYRGTNLVIDWYRNAPRRPRVEAERLVVGGPQESLAARLRRWLEAEAQAHLAQDLAFYCARIGQPRPSLRLSRANRRWGSCSSAAHGGDRTVRINWRLIMAPDAVRRSVVAHEVAHLAHFDHSPAFHALLARLYEGDLADADLWLKREGRTLYAPFG